MAVGRQGFTKSHLLVDVRSAAGLLLRLVIVKMPLERVREPDLFRNEGDALPVPQYKR